MGTDVAERQDTLPQTRQGTAITPADMLQSALDRGLDPESLQKFMDLYDRFEAKQAKAAFDQALADFKRNPPKVVHDLKNAQYDSTYSSLANLVNTVNASLAEHGLNATWEYSQDETIHVTCVLSHTQGHSVRTTLSGPPDDSGKKNSLQQIKSTTTYLRGATFEAVTGVATTAVNKDDDGNGAAGPAISEQELADLEALVDEVGADKAQFCKVCKVESLADLPKSKLKGAIAKLEQKRKQKS